MARHRKFTPEFKAQVVLEVISGAKSAAEVCRQYQLKPQLVTEWKATFLANAVNAFQADAQLQEAQTRIAELERLVGRQALELEVAKKAFSSLSSPSSKSER
jgi:transposase-like protein